MKRFLGYPQIVCDLIIRVGLITDPSPQEPDDLCTALDFGPETQKIVCRAWNVALNVGAVRLRPEELATLRNALDHKDPVRRLINRCCKTVGKRTRLEDAMQFGGWVRKLGNILETIQMQNEYRQEIAEIVDKLNVQGTMRVGL